MSDDTKSKGAKRGRKPDPAVQLRKRAEAVARRFVGSEGQEAAVAAIVELATANAAESVRAFVTRVEAGLTNGNE